MVLKYKRRWFRVLGSLSCMAGCALQTLADDLQPTRQPVADRSNLQLAGEQTAIQQVAQLQPTDVKLPVVSHADSEQTAAAAPQVTISDALLTDPQDVFRPTALHLQPPSIGPTRIGPQQFDSGVQSSLTSQQFSRRLFGSAKSGRNLLNARRRRFGGQPATAIVLGSEARFRLSTDAGDLLKKSPGGLGITGQRRSPIITDTQIRGGRIGSMLASGSYWFPARQDLDTLMSKMIHESSMT